MKRFGLFSLFLLSCGGSRQPPEASRPVVTVPSTPPSSASSAAPASNEAPPFPVIPLRIGGTCGIRGAGVLSRPLTLRFHGKPFALVPDAEWLEVYIPPSSAIGTVTGRSKTLDFAGEVDTTSLEVSPTTRVLREGWFAADSFLLREVSTNGELLGAANLPRVVVAAQPIEVAARCADAVLATQAANAKGTLRVFRRGASGTLKDAPGGKVVGKLAVPPKLPPGSAEERPFLARVLEERGKEVKIFVRDRSASIEAWTESSALLSASDPDAQATLLAEQAEGMQLAVLGGGGGGAPQPRTRTCRRPINVFVRDAGTVVAIGAIREGVEIRERLGSATGPETPIDLGLGGTNGLVPFVLESAMAACAKRVDEAPPEMTVIAQQGRGLVPRGTGAGPVPPATSPPPTEGPKAEAQIGAVTTDDPIPDGQRVIVGLRPRFRQCYQVGLNTDPSMSGSVVLTAKVTPKGEVSSCDVTRNTGLSPGVATCLANVVKRAMFEAPGRPTRISIPATFAPRP